MKADADFFKVLGKAILLASMQFSIGSVEMSSKFSVMNFSKDQQTLQRASDSLTHYLIVSTLWTAGTCFLLYSSYGAKGLIINLIANLGIVAWIVISYIVAFKYAAKQNGLRFPKLFQLG
jgi:hypothetical protein